MISKVKVLPSELHTRTFWENDLGWLLIFLKLGSGFVDEWHRFSSFKELQEKTYLTIEFFYKSWRSLIFKR